MEGAGHIRSFTVLHQSLEEEPLEEPEVVALIGWPQVRGGIIHRVKGMAPDTVCIGTAVEPVWAEERTGAMTDIIHFRPVG